MTRFGSFNNSFTRNISAISIAFISISTFFSRIRLEPNPLHDGYVYSAALATTQGFVPNRDFFSQYGPVFPYIQGIFLDIFGNQIISLRIANAIFLTITAILLFHLCSLKLSSWGSFAGALLWVSGISAGWTTLLPWVNVVTTLIVLTVITMTKFLKIKDYSWQTKKFGYFSSGIILSTIPFLRIQTAPIFVLFLVVSYVIFRSDVTAKYFNNGVLIGILTQAAILHFMGALLPYIQQCLIWPFTFYEPQKFTLEGIAPNFYFIFIPVFWLVLRKLIKDKIKYLLLIVSIFLSSIIYTQQHELSYLSISHPDILLNNILNSLLGTSFYATVFIAFYVIFAASRKTISKEWKLRGIAPGIGIIILSLSQLYPAWDPAHIWWISPLIIVGVLEVVPLNSSKQFISNYQVVAAGLILTGMISAGTYQWQLRGSYDSQILKGMVSIESTRSLIEENILELNFVKSSNINFKYDFPDALYAVSDGQVRRSGIPFINWGPSSSSDYGGYDEVFVCNQTIDYIQEKYLSTHTLKRKLPSVDFPEKNNWILEKNE